MHTYIYSSVSPFSSVYSLGFLHYTGLRLHMLHQFQAFLTSSAFAESVTSYHFASVAPRRWRSAFSWAAPVVKVGRSLLAFGSNISVKPTANPLRGFASAYLSR